MVGGGLGSGAAGSGEPSFLTAAFVARLPERRSRSSWQPPRWRRHSAHRLGSAPLTPSNRARGRLVRSLPPDQPQGPAVLHDAPNKQNRGPTEGDPHPGAHVAAAAPRKRPPSSTPYIPSQVAQNAGYTATHLTPWVRRLACSSPGAGRRLRGREPKVGVPLGSLLVLASE